MKKKAYGRPALHLPLCETYYMIKHLQLCNNYVSGYGSSSHMTGESFVHNQ